MDKLRQAAQRVLDYWETCGFGDAVMVDKMDDLRSALAEPVEQEPRTEVRVDFHGIGSATCPMTNGTVFVSDVTMRDIAARLRPKTEPAEQEPVGYFSVNDYGRWEENEGTYGEPFYTAPQPAKREPLTDEEIDKVTNLVKPYKNDKPIYGAQRLYARAIEAAHGITKDKP